MSVPFAKAASQKSISLLLNTLLGCLHQQEKVSAHVCPLLGRGGHAAILMLFSLALDSKVLIPQQMCVHPRYKVRRNVHRKFPHHHFKM